MSKMAEKEAEKSVRSRSRARRSRTYAVGAPRLTYYFYSAPCKQNFDSDPKQPVK